MLNRLGGGKVATVWLVGLAMLCVGLVGLGLGSMVEDADAAKKKELKTLWAVVDADGTLVRGKGVTGNNKLGTGTYGFFFNRNVEGCAWVATLREGNAGEISVGFDDLNL